MPFTTWIWVNKLETILKRNVCGGHVGVPFKNTNMAAKTRKSFAAQNFYSSWFGFATDHTKSNLRVFSTALNISICSNLLIFVTSETRIIMIMKVVNSNKILFSAQTFWEYVYNRVLNHITTRTLQHQYFRFKIFCDVTCKPRVLAKLIDLFSVFAAILFSRQSGSK